MTFLYNWFGQAGEKNFWNFLMPLAGKPGLSFLEIGCFEGRATDWMLRNVLTAPDSRITVIDPFTGSSYYKEDKIVTENLRGRFEENIAHNKEKVKILQGFSQEILRDVKDIYDFIYIDGSHKAGDTLEDAVLAWRMLKSGGIMIFDDYKWHKYEDEHLNPKMGIESFLTVFGDQLDILLEDYQVIVKKK